MGSTSGRLIRESWDQVAGQELELARVFYARLFEIAPTRAALFAGTDMALQRGKFAEMIAEIARHAERPESLFGELKGLAERHIGYGVAEADYALVGDALIFALTEVLGPAMGPETRTAWGEGYHLTAAVMLRAHHRKGGG
jgi:hemoglobin-like flavoprotein